MQEYYKKYSEPCTMWAEIINTVMQEWRYE